jgi:hypothetical protein
MGESRADDRWLTMRRAVALVATGAAVGGGVAAAFLLVDRPVTVEVDAAATAPEAPEPDAPSEPEEEPEPEPVDLREVDWAAATRATTCVALDDGVTLTDEPQPVTLEAAEDGAEVGWFHAAPNTTLPSYEVDVDGVIYADITGDGEDEAIFETWCTPGNVREHALTPWQVGEDGEPAQLPDVLARTDREALIHGFEAVDGGLRVETREPAPGLEAPHLEPYLVEVVTDYRFDGRQWAADEVSRVDTTPPPPEPEPEHDTADVREHGGEMEHDPGRPDPRPGACESLGLGMTDEQYCEEVWRGMEACEQRMDDDPDWVYNHDTGGWDNVVTGDWEPSCDV